MAWKIEVSETAKKQFQKLDKPTAKRLISFLRERLAPLENPRSIGEALKGPELGNLWKYWVGDYRLLCKIEDNAVLILVVRLGNRRDVYKRGS